MIEPEAESDMLRRLIAAMLVAAIAIPLPALAWSGCPMTEPMLASERCTCCDDPAAAATAGCASVAAVRTGCDCSLRTDTGNQPGNTASGAAAATGVSVNVARIPASLSTPQRATRVVHLAASPPGPGAFSRSLLCTWLI